MDSSTDKIDLSVVNKTKKKFKFPKLTNPFKRNSAGPGRDMEGKFTSGSGGLLASSKFNFKRTLPLVVVVALVGGFLVFRSFAAVATPSEYQYSIATCKVSNNKDKPDTTCKDKSAEALVYRIQSAALGRQTDYGYKTWTQRLAGDRATSYRVAQEAEGTQEARWGSLSNKDYVEKVAGVATPTQKAAWTKQINEKKLSRVQLAENVANLFKTTTAKVLESTYKYNNKQFVEAIYKNLLKRGDAYAANTTDYWLKTLNEGKANRAQVIVGIAKSPEAVAKNREAVATYVASKPKLEIIQTAITKQKKRESEAAQDVKFAEKHFKDAERYAGSAKTASSNAKKLADQPKPTMNTLNSIKNFDNQAKAHLSNATRAAQNAKSYFNKANKLLADAKTVTKHSADIPSSAVELSRNKAAVYAAGSENKVKDINSTIGAIATSYKTAESKYQAEQARIAQAAAPAASTGANPCNGVRSNSGKDAIKACQRYLGVTADGIWGKNTENAFKAKFGKGSGYTPPVGHQCFGPYELIGQQTCRVRSGLEVVDSTCPISYKRVWNGVRCEGNVLHDLKESICPTYYRKDTGNKAICRIEKTFL